MTLRRFHISHPARFAFAALAAATIAMLVEMGTMRENSERNLHKAHAAAQDSHFAADAERFFLPDDFVKAGQVLQHDRNKVYPRLEPILRAISEHGAAAVLGDDAVRRRVMRLNEAQRVALVWMFFRPQSDRPGGVALRIEEAGSVAENFLQKVENVDAFRRISADPTLLSRSIAKPYISATSDFKSVENREALYRAIQSHFLKGEETPFRTFAVAFAEEPPVKPLSLQRQLVLTKELELLFLIGRGRKATPRAQALLDGYYIRNEILRDKLKSRIDVYTAKKSAPAAGR